MNAQIHMNILKQADEITLQRIAEEFPIDFGKEEIFEKAYAAYLERSAAAKPPIKRHAMHIAAAAACCILVLGAAYAIGIAPRQIPSVKEEPTTESPSTTQPTQESHAVLVPSVSTETTDAPTTHESVTSTSTQEGTTNAVTAPPPVLTDPTEPSSPQTTATEDAPTAEETTAPPVATDPTMDEPTAWETTAPPVATDPTMDEPAAWETIEPTEPRTEKPSERPPAETESPEKPTDRPPLQTESPQRPTECPPEIPTEHLPTLEGYDIIDRGNYLEIVWQQAVTPSPFNLHPYRMQSERFSPESTSLIQERRKYRVLDTVTGEEFFVYQSRREQFSATCEKKAVLTHADVGGNPAFLVQYTSNGTKYCSLYWDDGMYTFTVTSTLANRELLVQLARGMCLHT